MIDADSASQAKAPAGIKFTDNTLTIELRNLEGDKATLDRRITYRQRHGKFPNGVKDDFNRWEHVKAGYLGGAVCDLKGVLKTQHNHIYEPLQSTKLMPKFKERIIERGSKTKTLRYDGDEDDEKLAHDVEEDDFPDAIIVKSKGDNGG